MKGKQVYIDTNIFVYVALKHPDFYRACYNILNLLISKEFSNLVSEDVEDWSRIVKVWSEIKNKFKVKDLTIISPTKGVIEVE